MTKVHYLRNHCLLKTFFQGAAVRIHLIDQDGEYENVVVSKDNPTHVINPNLWFAAEVLPNEGQNH